MLTNQYNDLFKECLTSFAEQLKILSNIGYRSKKYALFYPTIGKDYPLNRELLVYGQAVNGWCPEVTPDDIPQKTTTLIGGSIAYSAGENGKCPLEWVNEDWVKYQLYRSFFWNVTYKLMKAAFNRTDQDWNRGIVWSNLMKIAPAQHANPDATEQMAQLDFSAKLFIQEL